MEVNRAEAKNRWPGTEDCGRGSLVCGKYAQIVLKYCRKNVRKNYHGAGGMSSSRAEKRDRFRGLAESRTNKAIEAISRIGNLSNKQVYEFEEAEVRKIIKALKDAITAVEARFEAPRGRSKGNFKL